MANAAGGAILYGISERASAADAASGLRFTDADAEIRRLSQVVQSGVEPRIAGIRFSTITLEDGDVLAVDVPQSFDAPHRYLFSGHSKFVQRVGTHVSELTYDQLRAAFDRSNQRLASIRQEWLADFGLTRLWRALPQRPICVIRLSSLLSADGRQTVDPQDAMSRWSDLIQSSWYGGSPSYNYEGLVVAPSRDDTLES